jgi:hypothetical protein
MGVYHLEGRLNPGGRLVEPPPQKPEHDQSLQCPPSALLVLEVLFWAQWPSRPDHQGHLPDGAVQCRAVLGSVDAAN